MWYELEWGGELNPALLFDKLLSPQYFMLKCGVFCAANRFGKTMNVIWGQYKINKYDR